MVEVEIFNLFKKNSRDKGVYSVKAACNSSSFVRVVAGGGDGSIMWVVQELVNKGVDMGKIVIGILPFGTGNDFSRVTGWGSKLAKGFSKMPHKVLLNLIEDWMKGEVQDFDLWDLKIDLQGYGEFALVYKRNGRTSSFPLRNEDGKIRLSFERTFANYASFGVDASITYGFEQKRTNYRTMNKLVYVCEFFRSLCSKKQTLNKLVKKMEIIKPGERKKEKISSRDTVFVESEDLEEKHLSSLFNLNETDIQEKKEINFWGAPVNLLALNIQSNAGGVKDVWLHAKDKGRVTKSSPQSFGDGLLELVSYNSIRDIGQERFCVGNAQKVCQGPGDFVINFKEGDKSKPIVTYFQVDGESMKVTAPKTLQISKSKLVPEGKINVLVKRINKNSAM